MAWEFTYSGLAERGVLLDLNTMLARDTSFAAELRADSVAVAVRDIHLRRRAVCVSGAVVRKLLVLQQEIVRRGRRATTARAMERAVEFRRVPRHRQGAHQARPIGSSQPMGIRRHLGAVLLGHVVRHEQRGPVVESADEPDAPQLRQRTRSSRASSSTPIWLTSTRSRPPRRSPSRCPPTDLFTSGHAAMALGGHWRYQTLERAKDLDFDIAVLPTGPKGHAAHSNIGTTGLAIASSSPRKQQAWEFVKFATGPDRAGSDRRIGPLRAGAAICDPVGRFRLGPQQNQQSRCADRRTGARGGPARHPGVAEDRCVDGP